MALELKEIDGLPDYKSLDPSSLEQFIEDLLANHREEIRAIIAHTTEEPTWDNLAQPLEELDDYITKAWAPISQINSVVSTPELREAHDNCLPHLSRYETEMKQSGALYAAFKALRDSKSFSILDSARRKVISDTLLDFELSGVALEDAKKKRFAEISERLSVLSSEFSNRVLDATDAWSKHIQEASSLEGLSELQKRASAEAARVRGLDGYLLTLEMPSYISVIRHAEDRELRGEVHEAYVTRASDAGPCAGRFDNTETLMEIIRLRRELTELLGYLNYADYSVAKKMAASGKEVREFLEEMLAKALPKAREELIAVQFFASEKYGIDDVQAWDIRFLEERMREDQYGVSNELLRPYFPLDHVVDGMFRIVERLYGIRIEEKPLPDTWHDDVRFYEILRGNEKIARFYLDAFARANKRSGAWMDSCRVRREYGNFLQIPVAYLNCNASPPLDGMPALLTHSDVVTLFHEFGHGLHHMLTRQQHGPVSGINGVSWDAVELPSQFMENWCWQPEGIAIISSHYETGEPLPKALLDRLLAAKNFQSGLHMVSQLEFALFDVAIHETNEEVDPMEVLRNIYASINLIQIPEYNRFPCSFEHIFAGGYAAGYYSYLWAEVLSADAFAAFEETGIFNEDTGKRFLKHILEVGGSKSAAEMYRDFRGRDATMDALLRHSGLA